MLAAPLLALLVGAVAGAPAAQAAISIGDVTVGETGAEASFTVTRTAGLLTGNATVAFATADATAHAPADYTALSPGGTLFFGSLPLGGVQTQVVTVAVRPDALHEADESFRLVLSGSAEIVDGEGLAAIIDDDAPPTVAVTDAPATAEGTGAAFGVALSAPSGRDVAVAYATADGTATAGEDYTPQGGTVTIPAGATSAGIGVATLDDGADEPDERFELLLGAPSGAALGSATAGATIVDNDEPLPPASAGELTAPANGPIGPDAVPAGALPPPQLGLSGPRLRRPSIVLVTVSCPRSTSRCSGRVTIFSRANLRSRIKALRRERRLGQRNFTLLSGRTRTLTIALSRHDRVLLMRAGRMLVRAFAVTRDGAGRSSVRRSTGTLIARTTHS